MPNVTISIPTLPHERLLKHAKNNGCSFSYSITKMSEIGLDMTENGYLKNNNNERFSDIEKHCFNLIIQMNALIKNIASEVLGYDMDDFNKLLELTNKKYKKLTDNEF